MNGEEEALVATIRDDTSDDTARLVYADWLEERNDLRAEYLRLVVEVAERTRSGKDVEHLTGRLGKLARSIKQEWREVVGHRYRIVLDLCETEKGSGLMRLLTAGLGRLLGDRPKRVRISVPMLREDADQLMWDAGAVRRGAGRPILPNWPSAGPLYRFVLELVDDRQGAGEELPAGEVAG